MIFTSLILAVIFIDMLGVLKYHVLVKTPLTPAGRYCKCPSCSKMPLSPFMGIQTLYILSDKVGLKYEWVFVNFYS